MNDQEAIRTNILNDQEAVRWAIIDAIVGDEALNSFAEEQLELAVEAVAAHPKGSKERGFAALDYNNPDLCSAIGHRSLYDVLHDAGLL